MLLLAVLAVLAAKAWGQEQAGAVPHDPWQAVGAGIGLVFGALSLAAVQYIREYLGERRKTAEPAQPDAQSVTRAEVRQMVTEAVQRVERDTEGQHRRVREELARLEREVVALGARLTTEQHANADRRETLAREMGQVVAGIESLRHAVEER